MKNPFEVARQLFRYLSREISGEEREEVEQLLARDRKLQELVHELQEKETIRQELNVLRSFEVEPALKKVTGKRRHYLLWWRVGGAVAAMAVLALGCWWLLQPSGHQEAQVVPFADAGVERHAAILETADGGYYALDTLSNIRLEQEGVEIANQPGKLTWEDMRREGDAPVQVAYNKVTVPYGGTYSLVLPDGSHIHLNSGTVLEFPSRFSEKERRIRVRGEIYCEVEHDTSWPFIVEAGQMSVQVLGTVFNVKAYDDEESITATLVEGTVSVSSPGKESRRLRPGQLAAYSRESGALEVREADVEAETAWKDGMFYFKQLPLGEILRIVARWYDLDVFYVNPDVADWKFNGKMPMYSSVGDVLKKFEYAGEVRFELKGRTLTVYKR